MHPESFNIYCLPGPLLSRGQKLSTGNADSSNFQVFVTASPANHQYLRSLGAFEVFDYCDPAVVENITAVARSAGTPIKLGFDSFGEGSSPKQSAMVLTSSGGEGGKLCLVLPWPDKEEKPPGIEISHCMAFRTGGDQTELGAWLFNDYLQNALQNGSIVPAPKIEVAGWGIAAAQKVFDKLKAGVSGKKLVVTLADAQ